MAHINSHLSCKIVVAFLKLFTPTTEANAYIRIYNNKSHSQVIDHNLACLLLLNNWDKEDIDAAEILFFFASVIPWRLDII